MRDIVIIVIYCALATCAIVMTIILGILSTKGMRYIRISRRRRDKDHI